MSTPFGQRGFEIGLLYGSAAAVLAVAAWGARRRLVPFGGMLLTAALLLALDRALTETGPWPAGPDRVPPGLVGGAIALVAAGLVARAIHQPWVGAILAAPGAYLIAAHGDLGGPSWYRWSAGVACVLGGALAEDLDRRWQAQGIGPALLAISVIGLYYTLPDTEESVVLLGVTIPLALAGWPLRLTALGPGGGFAAAGLLAWTVASGGVGRATAIVGGLGCFALLAGEPIVHALRRGRRHVVPPGGVVALGVMLAMHLAAVYLCGRVAGTAGSVTLAVVIAGAGLLVMSAAAAWVYRGARRGTFKPVSGRSDG